MLQFYASKNMKNMYGRARVYNTVHIIIYYCIIVIIVLSTVHMGLAAHTLEGLYIIVYIYLQRMQ